MYYCSLCNKKTPHYTDDKGFSTCTVCNRTNEEAISVANNESVNINEAHVQCTSCGKEMSTSDAKEANGNYYCFSCYKNAKNRGEISESKAKVDITSILEPLLDTINDMVTKNEDIGVIKKYIVDEINRHEIEVTDKKKMIWSISNINNNNSLQKYIYNSILKYKGLGTIKKTGESKIREYKENVKVAVLKNAEGKVTFVPYAIDKSDAEIKAEVGPSLFTISTLPQTSRPKYAMDFHKEVRDETLADIWNEIEKLGRRGVADNQEIATKVAAKLQLPVEEISAILAESKVVLPINKLLNKYNLNEEGPMLTPGGYSQGEPFGKDIKFIYDEKSWDDDRKILTFYKDKKPYAVFNAETKEVVEDSKEGIKVYKVETNESKINEDIFRYQITIPGLTDKGKFKRERRTVASNKAQAIVNVISRLIKLGRGELKYSGIELSNKNKELLISKAKEDPNIKIKKIADIKLGGSMAPVEDSDESKVNEVSSRYEVIIPGLNDKENMKDQRETTAVSETQAVANIISRLARSEKKLKYQGIEVSPQNIGLLVSKVKANVKKLTESKVNEEEGLAGNNATTFTPQVQEVIPPSVEVEEPKSEPEKEEIAIGGEKTYLGNNGNDEYFYLNIVGNKKGVVEELQVLDGNSDVIFTTKNSELDISDIKGFILVAIKEKDMANISTDIIDKYILPQEKPEETVAEEEVKTPSEEKPIKAEGETMSKVTPGVKPVESINKLMEKYGLDEKIKQGTAGDVVGAQLTLNIEVIRNLITLANKSLEKAIPEEKKEWELNIIELENSLKQLNKSLDEGTFKKGFGVKLSNINEDLYTLFTLFGGLKEDFKSDKDIKQWVIKYTLNIINGKNTS